jgi:hypothetical protein
MRDRQATATRDDACKKALVEFHNNCLDGLLRQQVIDGYTPILPPAAALVIETDGPVHDRSRSTTRATIYWNARPVGSSGPQ